MNIVKEVYKPADWAKSLNYIPTHKLNIARLPTPIIKLNYATDKFKALYCKRDDLSEFTITGNKIRKLEFLLADAVNKGCDTVITIGGIQSNHCRATAAACRMIGLDCHLILRTKDVNNEIGLEGNLLIDQLVNAKISLVSIVDYKKHGQKKLLDILADKLTIEGKQPYIIPVGGSNSIGVWGYIECVRELETQMLKNNIVIDDIVFACGSGGTAAGLSIGIFLSKLNVKVHGITVCDNAQYFHDHINEVLCDLKINIRSEDIINLIDDYRGIGYALSTKEELETLTDVAAKTSLILDPVYSGKAFHGLLNDKIFKGRRVLFVHTGGFFGTYEKVNQLLPIIRAYNKPRSLL